MKEMMFNAYDLHTMMLNENFPEIIFVADSYYEGEKIELTIVFDDIKFIEFISHKEIDTIKENLKKRIDNL
jgi:hypothetical protein